MEMRLSVAAASFSRWLALSRLLLTNPAPRRRWRRPAYPDAN